MAHKIDMTRNENGGFVSYQQPAWHKLGTVFNRAITVNDALNEGGLNFTVNKAPNIHRIPFNADIESTESFFTYRSDNNIILGSKLGKDYTVFQNSEALSFVQDILDKGTAQIETAGSIDQGKRVFICLKNSNQITVGSNDIVNSYVLITNSHDGTLAITAMPTNVRVVCNNTLQAALGSKGAIKIRHTINANYRVSEALKVLNLLNDSTQKSEDVYNTMHQNIISKNDLIDYIGNIFMSEEEIKMSQAGKKIDEVLSTRKQNIITDVLGFANRGIGQAQALNNDKLNMWYAYNAVTGYLTGKKYGSDNDRMNSLMYGDSANKIQLATQLATAPDTIKTLKKVNHIADISLN